jgi:hypothetical protein
VTASFTTAHLGVIPGCGGDVDQVVRKLAWEHEHEGGKIGPEDSACLVYEARHADGSLAASAYGSLGALMGQLDRLEDRGACPVHSPAESP